MSNELEVTKNDVEMTLSATQVSNQVQLVQQVMQAVMKDGEHYGTIPGCGTKKVLLKAGAEKLALTFKFAAQYKINITNSDNGHREYSIITTITHIPTNKLLGEGLGSCSTLESKYRYRNASYKCPVCGKDTIIKGKEEYGGGFICFAKKGGCGAKFKDSDKQITAQQIGRVENQDIADVYNTVLKIAKKRSLVDAILTATAASDIFTQDLEETMEMSKENKENIAIDTSIGEIICSADKAMGIFEQIEAATDYDTLKTIYKNATKDNQLSKYIKQIETACAKRKQFLLGNEGVKSEEQQKFEAENPSMALADYKDTLEDSL